MIGIVPAAGHARRLEPRPGSKELIDVHGRPVLEYLLRRLEVGGCSEIRIVTRPEKEDLRAYASRRGLRVFLGHPANVGASVAVALQDVPPDSLVALGFPDTLWEPLEGFALLRGEIDGETDAVLGLFATPDAARSDVVVANRAGRVVDIVVKPTSPPSDVVWGCLVARAYALAGVGDVAEVSDALRSAIAGGRVGSLRLSDVWLDIGEPAALAKVQAGMFPAVRA